MARHRGKILAFALSALMGLFASEGRAEIIGFVVDGIDTTPFTSPTPGALPGQGFTVDVGALNAALAATGSAYFFTSLSGSSNYPGGSTGALTLRFGVGTLSAGDTTPLVIAESEGGFTAPLGATGTLTSAPSGTFTQASGGTIDTQSTLLNGTTTAITTPLLTNTAVGDNSPFSGPNTGSGGPVSTLYTLTNSASITLPLASADGSVAPTIGGAVGAVLNATAVPEPTSIALLLTGMPLPLVVMGLFRRHRRQVA